MCTIHLNYWIKGHLTMVWIGWSDLFVENTEYFDVRTTREKLRITLLPISQL